MMGACCPTAAKVPWGGSLPHLMIQLIQETTGPQNTAGVDPNKEPALRSHWLVAQCGPQLGFYLSTSDPK